MSFVNTEGGQFSLANPADGRCHNLEGDASAVTNNTDTKATIYTVKDCNESLLNYPLAPGESKNFGMGMLGFPHRGWFSIRSVKFG